MDQYEHVHKTTEADSSGKRKTKCCDGFKMFFVALSFSYICKALGGIIMKTSITQIERRFDISSSVAGVIDGGFEIGNLFVIVFVSYFGSKLHRPKLIGIGCVIMGAGSIMTALPHFFMGYYRYSTETHGNTSENSLSTCLIGQTSSVTETPPEIVGKGCEKESKSYMWIFVLMGNMLRGIGESPISPLGISYLDDFAKEGHSSVYLGILNAVAIIGPIIGFTMGSLFAKMYVDVGYVDLNSIRITPQDARWVGAWWLGFLVSGLLSIISSIPFFFLPQNPYKPEKQRRKLSTTLHALKTDEEKDRTDNLTSHAQDVTIADFLKSMKCLLTNRLYILYMIMGLINISSLIGAFTYLLKFLEQQYGRTASQATFYLGVITLPSVAVGMLLGGFLIKKLKLTIVGIAKFSLLIGCLGLIFNLPFLALLCESKSVAGLTLTYDGINPVRSHTHVPLSSCNSDCNCDESQWEPVCGDNGITYLSPCLAGCKSRGGSEKPTVYYNCSCIEVSGFPSTNFSGHLGECPRDDTCKKKFNIYLGGHVVLAFVGSLGGTSFILILVRIVQPELKSLAMGFHTLIIRTLGGILAPIYYGAVIDRTCLRWSKTSCGTRGACRIYNSLLFGYSFMGLNTSLRFVSIILFFVFLHLLKKKYEGKNSNALENGGKFTNEANLESSNNNEYSVPSATVKETHIQLFKVQLSQRRKVRILAVAVGFPVQIFLAALSFTYLCRSLGGTIMKSSITQIEKRFEISSSVAGLIDGSFEIGNLFVIVFVSYFGSKLHRPKLIGIGCVIMGAGSIMTALPHFFMGYYRYSTETHGNTSENSLSTCLIGQTSSVTETPPEIVGKGCEKESKSYMWIFVLMGNMLRGIGESPISPLGISYLDDFAKEGHSSVYLGILNAVAIIGPIIGFTMGSLFAKMYVDVGYVDLNSIRITPQDARWVGAWWLGFLVSGLLSIISSIPFFFLPQNPYKPEKQRRKLSTTLHALKTDEEKDRTDNLTSHAQDVTIADFLKSMKCLLTNRLYILYMIMGLINISSLIGAFTYLLKFLEQQYGRTASQATFYLGVITLPSVAVGMLLGGFLIKKLKLTIVGIAKFSLLIGCLGLIFNLPFLALLCESKSVAGLTLTYDGINPVRSHTHVPLSSCNSDCNCDESQWEPVCGDNGITYLSPCLAGCKSRGGSEKPTVYYNCSCIEVSGFPSTNFSGHLGECPRDDTCKKKFNIYLGGHVVLAFVGSLGGTSFILILVRIVQPELKSLAMGFHTLIIRTLGGILAPIYYGAVIDRTCLRWSKTSCGTRGACRIYNSLLFGYSFMGLNTSLRFVSIILFFVFLHLLKKKYEGKNSNALENGGKFTNEANLESSNNNEYSVPSATVKETHM